MFHQRPANSRTQFYGSVVFSTLVLMVLFAYSARGFIPDVCTSNSDCEAGYCCMLSMNRYSIPTCHLVRAEGEPCRKASEKHQNLTVSYPNGKDLKLKRVHLVLCPCDEGLNCEDQVCVKR